jgi:hypothetical protein
LAIAARALGTALNEHNLQVPLPRSDSVSPIAVRYQSLHNLRDGSPRGSKGNTVRPPSAKEVG